VIRSNVGIKSIYILYVVFEVLGFFIFLLHLYYIYIYAEKFLLFVPFKQIYSLYKYKKNISESIYKDVLESEIN